MSELADGIRYLDGNNKGILVVAPHSAYEMVKGERVYRNDWRTGIIAEEIHKILGCFTIINDAYIRPDEYHNEKPDPETKQLDLYKAVQAKDVQGYLERIEDVVDKHDRKTLVVWVHGLGEDSAKSEQAEHIKAELLKKSDGDLHALIGYGQGAHPRLTKIKKPSDDDKKSRLTAEHNTVETFRDELTKRALRTLITRDDADNYRGRDPERLNQFFRDKKKYTFDKVETFQIEIREKGFREDEEQCRKTAQILADAISATLEMSPNISERAVVKQPKVEATVPIQIAAENKADEALAETAFQWLAENFKKHVTNFMFEAGEYIIKTFYGGNPRVAFTKNKSNEQPPSLNLLIQKITQSSSSPDGNAPSTSWFYKAVSLAAHEMICEQEGLSTFTILGHSHKLQLLNVPKLKGVQKDKLDDEIIKSAFVEKDRLASEAVVKDLSVRNFKKYIDTEHPSENGTIDLINLPPRDALINLGPAYLTRLYNSARTKIEEGRSDLKAYGKSVDNLGAALSTFQGENVEGGGKFRDWTDAGNNVNICTGCKNDCLYCYMKPMNARYPEKRKQSEDWHNFELRDHDVDKKQKLYSGLVGFPSSHDIFPEVLDAYLIVLGKLLRASNEVLIVSKPRLGCISRICEAAEFFKDRILFRFTIGAISDDILGYWEPHAPDYSERKECLEYAFNRGFRTSVSSEPLLDRNNAEILEADLMPFITEDMWFGKMSYISFLRKGANAELNKRLDQIEQGQTQDKRDALREVYKGNDKVKFKTGW